MQKNKLQGDFKVTSNVFAVKDFMVAQDKTAKENKTTSNKESLKIPEFLDCNITADVNTVIYDNLNLTHKELINTGNLTIFKNES